MFKARGHPFILEHFEGDFDDEPVHNPQQTSITSYNNLSTVDQPSVFTHIFACLVPGNHIFDSWITLTVTNQQSFIQGFGSCSLALDKSWTSCCCPNPSFYSSDVGVKSLEFSYSLSAQNANQSLLGRDTRVDVFEGVLWGSEAHGSDHQFTSKTIAFHQQKTRDWFKGKSRGNHGLSH